MADSGYYRRLFEQYEGQVREYEKNIATLQKIVNDFYNNLEDEQKGINRRLERLADDLGRAVRRNTKFTAEAARCDEGRQEAVTADAKLKEALSALENELSELNRKKDQACQMKDSCHRSYLNAKEEERRAALEALKISLSNSMTWNE